MSKHRAGWVTVAVAAAAFAGLTGCEDSARQPVAYHPPPPPSSVPAAAPSDQRPPAQRPSTPAIIVDRLPLETSGLAFSSLILAPPNGAQRLAVQVEALYEQAQREFEDGQLPAAQRDFLLAGRLLSESGFDLKSDVRLGALDSQIADAAAQADAAPSAQSAAVAPDNAAPAVPSPLDEITALTGAPDQPLTAAPAPGLLSSAEGELREVPHDLPLTVNDVVLSFLNFFQTPRGRAIVETGLNRAGRYRGMIEQVLRQEGLPGDLMYIAQAESAFQPQALSRAGARGLWQFMAWRGKEYGLEHTAWVDDRQDPEKATRAAAHHLRDLYAMFGDWYLVLAAYNSGPGTVEHAVERTGYADFWQLYRLNVLPKETKDYVPIIVALTLIAKDPARYGIEVQPADPVQADDVVPGNPLNLRLVAETLDVDVDALRDLNPQLLHLTTPADPAFVLHLPPGTADRFATEMAAIPSDKWLSWRQHRVAAGETLSGIARQFHVAPAAIAEVNGLESDGSAAGIQRIALETGTKLVIPAPEQAQGAQGARLRYRTRHGDTLESVADEFDVTVTDLKKWNGLRGNQLPVGVRLTIYPASIPSITPSTTAITASAKSTRPPAGLLNKDPHADPRPASAAPAPAAAAASRTASHVPAPALTAGGEKIIHRVKPGETLFSIAQAYMTTVEALRSGNRFLFNRPLEAGDALTIWLPR